jgi:hypothetical protein
VENGRARLEANAAASCYADSLRCASVAVCVAAELLGGDILETSIGLEVDRRANGRPVCGTADRREGVCVTLGFEKSKPNVREDIQ